MYARLLVYIRYGTHELGEDLLDLVAWQRAMFEKVVIQFVACSKSAPISSNIAYTPFIDHTLAVFQNQPYHGLGHYHLVQSRNMRVDKLAMMMDLAGKVRIILLGGFEHNLSGYHQYWSPRRYPNSEDRPWSHW